MIKDDPTTRPFPRTRLDMRPELVCIRCGNAYFGPMMLPTAHIFQDGECELCATTTTVVHARAFRDYVWMFSEE